MPQAAAWQRISRIADAGEGQVLRRPIAATRRIGIEPGVEDRQAAPPRALDHPAAPSGGPDHQQRLRVVELHAERRPQRAGRERLAVADAAAAVDDDDSEILGERAFCNRRP